MFACLFIPDFPVEAIVRIEPELRARAVAVLAGRPPLEKVVALNEKARQAGVEVGSTKSQLEAWKELVLRIRSEVQEASAHAALLDCARSFSPEVEDTAPGIVLVNLAGLESLLGPFAEIAREMARRVLQMGVEANVGVAANPDAALLVAHGFSGVTLIPPGHEAERLGELPVDVLLECFSSSNDEGARWLETFDRWGIRNLRALAGLPEVPLSERLGQQGIRLQKLARGAVVRDLRLFEPALVFEESVELEYPILLLEPLAFLLNRMLEQICARLGARARAAQELRLTLELDVPLDAEKPLPTEGTEEHRGKQESDRRLPAQVGSSGDCSSHSSTSGSTFTRTLRLPVPMLNAKVFLKLLQLDLQAHPPGAPILKIHLAAEPAYPRTTQSGLFLPAFPEPEKLELTLARISGIVGEGRVGTAELLDTHREAAFEMCPFAPSQEEKKSAKREKGVAVQEQDDISHGPKSNLIQTPSTLAPTSLHLSEISATAPFPKPTNGTCSMEESAQEKMAAVIALRLFRPRLRAVVNVQDGKPVKLKCLVRKDVKGAIVWSAGPWRSSGDWAEQEGWAREEWDVAMQLENEIVLYRLVEDKLTRQWWVEGTYD